MTFPELGRGLVVRPGQELPLEWQNQERVRVDRVSLPLVQHLYRAWSLRQPLVVELGLDPQELRRPQSSQQPPWQLKPDFSFDQESLHFLLWANNYDGTRGEPIWWHGRLAQRLGASAEVLVDGGPRNRLPYDVLHRESVELERLGLSLAQGQPDLELAPDQLQAVTHQGCSACILAPAGSGKTRVLTQRLAYLLHRGIEPHRLMALAYNRRAASEMRQRLPQAQSCISTLHALGYGLLRRHRGVQLASEADQRALLTRILKPAALLNQDPLQPYLEGLQRIRLGLRDPVEVESQLPEAVGLAAAFPRYRQALAERGWVDHDEQIYGCLELLLSDAAARKEAQLRCTHLLVDEFQDLTPAFVLLVRLLAGPACQVFGVGDDDQVIYGYAGARPEFLLQFDHYFPQASLYQLQVNYRCPGPLVQSVGRLLSHNRQRVPKLTQPHPQAPPHQAELLLCPAAEAGFQVMVRVEEWLAHNPPESLAILARVNAQLLPLQVSLLEAGLEVCAGLNGDLLKRTGIRTALAYLRLAQEQFSSADLADALRRPNRKLKRELIEQASRCRNATELQRLSLRLDPWPASQIEEFGQDLALLRRRLQQGVGAFFESLRLHTQFCQALDQLDGGDLGSAGTSHGDDLRALEQTAAGYGSRPPRQFENWLQELLQRPSSPQGVRLSSIHRVKGLEWPLVIVFGADQGLMPHRLNPDLEEERRVFHVAVTRARQRCLIVADPETLSPFVRELAGA